MKADFPVEESAAQLRVFVEQAPVAIAMFDRDMRYIAASGRWLRDHGIGEMSVIGRTHYEVVPESERFKDEHRRGFAGETLREERDLFVRADGRLQWLKWEVRPWRAAGGSIGGIFITIEDVTATVKAEEALRQSQEDLNRAQAVAHTGSWRLDVKRNELTWSAEAFRIFGTPPGTPLSYESFLATVHPDDREHVDRSWKAAIEGAPYDIEHRILIGRETKWVRERAELEFDEAGGVLGGFGTVQDITDKKQADEQIRLLMQEVNHRSKNMLSVVLAIARQTVATNPDDFMDRFGERIRALAASQDLLVKNEWRGVDLDELIRSQLAHLIGARIHLRGTPVFVSARAAQTLGLIIHELATNAGKYGALAAAGDGSVEVVWSLNCHERKGWTFAIYWSESGGPPVTVPSRTGFGSTFIRDMATRSLDAKVELDYASGGLTWRLECPAAEVMD
jgi:PAS domain S-box-containing protein